MMRVERGVEATRSYLDEAVFLKYINPIFNIIHRPIPLFLSLLILFQMSNYICGLMYFVL